MKKYMLISLLIAPTLGFHAQAQSIDIIGGGGGDSAQTMHHCGFLPTGGGDYASSPLTVRIIQKKLAALGYYHAGIDGQYGPASTAAMRAFQLDYGIPVSGRTDGDSASHLAFATHSAANVQRCTRTASNYWR